MFNKGFTMAFKRILITIDDKDSDRKEKLEKDWTHERIYLLGLEKAEEEKKNATN